MFASKGTTELHVNVWMSSCLVERFGLQSYVPNPMPVGEYDYGYGAIPYGINATDRKQLVVNAESVGSLAVTTGLPVNRVTGKGRVFNIRMLDGLEGPPSQPEIVQSGKGQALVSSNAVQLHGIGGVSLPRPSVFTPNHVELCLWLDSEDISGSSPENSLATLPDVLTRKLAASMGVAQGREMAITGKRGMVAGAGLAALAGALRLGTDLAEIDIDIVRAPYPYIVVAAGGGVVALRGAMRVMYATDAPPNASDYDVDGILGNLPAARFRGDNAPLRFESINPLAPSL